MAINPVSFLLRISIIAVIVKYKFRMVIIRRPALDHHRSGWNYDLLGRLDGIVCTLKVINLGESACVHRPTLYVHVLLEFLDFMKSVGQFDELLSTCYILALLYDLNSDGVFPTYDHLLYS